MPTGHNSRSAFRASLTFSLATLAAQQFWRLYTCQTGPSRRGEAGLQGDLDSRGVAHRHLEPPKQHQRSATNTSRTACAANPPALKPTGKEEKHTQQHSPVLAQPHDEAIARLFLCLDLPLLLGVGAEVTASSAANWRMRGPRSERLKDCSSADTIGAAIAQKSTHIASRTSAICLITSSSSCISSLSSMVQGRGRA